MIKCSLKSCSDNNQRKKQGCAKNHNPSACKGYLMTTIDAQQARIESLEKLVKNVDPAYVPSQAWFDDRDEILKELEEGE